jgi:translation initiation factor 2 subunit 1
MRYYEARYPEVEELVMVQVRQIAEMGAYVKLVRSSKSIPPIHCTRSTLQRTRNKN